MLPNLLDDTFLHGQEGHQKQLNLQPRRAKWVICKAYGNKELGGGGGGGGGGSGRW